MNYESFITVTNITNKLYHFGNTFNHGNKAPSSKGRLQIFFAFLANVKMGSYCMNNS